MKQEDELNTDKNIYKEERELLHKQLELLAEQSKSCQSHELAELSGQMVNLFCALNN